MQEGKTNLKRSVKPGMDLVNIKLALDDIYLMLTSVNEYADKVLVSAYIKHLNLITECSGVLLIEPFSVWKDQHGFEYW